MKPLYFFSYSRQELYFAEFVVLGLQKAGLNIWFDLQQLEPGCEWSAEIDRGLSTCDGMIVLASHASLHSPWVALEWKHALEAGKPIHIVLFEAVTFDLILASEQTNNQPIPLDELKKSAVSIVDMRRHFDKNVARLATLIDDKKTEYDPIPTPNRWRLPTAMPLAVGFVAFSLAFLMALMIWSSLWGFSVYWPMMAAGLMTSAWLGDRTIAFLRRRSFREARVILPLAALISPFISLWFTPILAVGAVLIFRSADILRWSPLGQGIDRGRYQTPIPQNVTPPRTWLERLAHGYVERLRGARWFVLGGVVLCNLFLLDSGRALWMLIFPLLAAILVLFELVNRRLSRPVPSGVGYQIVFAPEDTRVARQVEIAMARAGHERLHDDSPKAANFVIIVLSNYTPDTILQSYATSTSKLICIAASALDDWARYKPLARFQWVDYRRQQSERLAAMALDILNIGSDKVGYSFSTHQTPQGFEKLLVPGKVAAALTLTYISVCQMVWALMQTLLSPSIMLPIGFVLIETAAFVPTYIWLMIRITRREITIWLTVALGLVVSLLTIVAGSQLDVPGLRDNLVINGGLSVGFALLITYPLYRLWLGNWLPPRIPRGMPLLALRRDWPQWRFYLAIVIVTGLLSVAFLKVDYAHTPPNDSVRPVTYNNQLTLSVPDYWAPIDSDTDISERHQTVMLAKGLGRVSLTFGTSLEDVITTAMLGSNTVPTVVANPPIVFYDTGETGWRLVDDSLYVPDASQLNRSLRFSLWAYPHGFLYKDQARSVLGIVENIATLKSMGAVTENPVTDTITRFEESFAYQGAPSNDLPLSLRYHMVVFSTPDTAFLISIAGDSDTMTSEAAAIQKTIASAQFDITAQTVPVTVDQLHFNAPAIWQTVTTPDIKDPKTWQGPFSDVFAIQYLQNIQNAYDQTGLPIHIVWGAKVEDGAGSTLSMSVAHYDNASIDDLIGFMQAMVQQSKQSAGVELIDDKAELLRDALGIEIAKFNVSGSTLWYAGMLVDGQTYLIQIASDQAVMAGYTDVLRAWLASFAAAP